jgi:toxin ParE1/3/4
LAKIFQMLVENPLAGRERPELRKNLRSFPVGSYVVFYIPVSDGIEVARVMNSRQDIDPDDMA